MNTKLEEKEREKDTEVISLLDNDNEVENQALAQTESVNVHIRRTERFGGR